MLHKISKEKQINELIRRVPPVLNVGIVIYRNWEYLIGKHPVGGSYVFPGSRMRFDETLQEAASRVLKNEAPGINAKFKKIITAIDDRLDPRSNNVCIYFLFDYVSGIPKENKKLSDFKWVDQNSFNKLKEAWEPDKKIFWDIDQAVRSMNTTEDEILVKVNTKNEEIGSISKREAHTNPKVFHRAAHIMIFTSKGEVVLQQRGFNKSHNPGQWDMPGGHQSLGTTIEETAKMELKEEMGIATNLKLVRVGLKKDAFQAEFYYLFYGIHDGPYKFDPHEVANVKTFNCDDLLNGKYDKEFSILSHVYGYVKELKNVWDHD